MLSKAQILDACIGVPDNINASSAYGAYFNHGESVGLGQPHRDVQYFAQIMHESGDFRFDQELWGPTKAQKGYEGRADLGNTQKGDGYKFRGRSGIQLTGRANYQRFTAWARKKFPTLHVPDFEQQPELINTDPWEGLVALWYWDVGNPEGKSLNRYADRGDNEMITRRVNGGTNGLGDRLLRYRRLALIVLGYGPNDVRAFQKLAKAKGLYKGEVDGMDGPQTRVALHKSLVALTSTHEQSVDVAPSPTTETKVVVPPQIDKPVAKTSAFWERIAQVLAGSGAIGAALLKDWQTVAVVGGFTITIAIGGLILHKRIIDAVRSFRTLRE